MPGTDESGKVLFKFLDLGAGANPAPPETIYDLIYFRFFYDRHSED
jgi:hypothetical protein